MMIIPKHIQELKPYKSGNQIKNKISEEEFNKLVNLASNENPLGASPLAIQAIKDNLKYLSIYPDPSGNELVTKLSDFLKIEKNRIITGSGSDSIIADVIKAFTVEGDELITASGTFIGTFVNTNKLNRVLKTVPLTKDFAYDLDAIYNAITPKTKIIYIANPNNPTGLMISKNELDKFIQYVPKNILIMLDEAYSVYSQEYEDYPDGLKYNHENIIVLRTMSKSYGLAGLRVGFAVSSKEIIDYLYRVKLPFEPNILAQKAAIAALDDNDFIKRTIETNNRNLNKLKSKFKELEIEYTDGKANFLLIDLNDPNIANNFADLSLKQGFIVRTLGMFGLDSCVRINSGTDEQTDKAIKIFEQIIKEIIKWNFL